MNKYAKHAKKCIFKIISQIAASPHPFLFDSRSFSRKRKLDIPVLFRLILSMGSNSLNYEIGSFFQYRNGFPSSSAFVQQRQKLCYTAFESAFQKFQEQTATLPLLFKGFRLLALDGTELTFLPGASHSPVDSPSVSKLHLNGLFDLLSKSFVDALVQDAPEKDETGAACEIVDRVADKYPAVFVADRNYESYNFFAHVEERLFDYVVRIKDRHSNGMLSGMVLPDSEEFDLTRKVVITRHHSGVTEVFPWKYKYFTKKKRFDYIEDSTGPDYTLTIRFVRFRLPDGTYECLATSLPQEQFSAEDLKKIYQTRWGIETSFRELKYVLGLAAFHAKKKNSVLQEVFARLIMYNFSMYITGRIKLEEKFTKKPVQVNYTQAVRICMHFFRQKEMEPPYDIEATIKRFLLPVRPGRNYPRRSAIPDVVSFNYRLA